MLYWYVLPLVRAELHLRCHQSNYVIKKRNLSLDPVMVVK